MTRIIRQLIPAIVLSVLLSVLACTGHPEAVDVPPQTVSTSNSAEPSADISVKTGTPVPTIESTEVPSSLPSPSPTSVPSPATATIGAVGDIMMPSIFVSDARTKDGTYSFETLFAPFMEIFQSVDLMCGNLETPVAGDDAGYEGVTAPNSLMTAFNAPDSMLDTLKEYGFDLLTTANNHCLDKGGKGLYRTIEKVREKGFYQTGTYLGAEDRKNPCIVEINGIRIGFVASTRVLNGAYRDILTEEEHTVIGHLTDDGKTLSAEVLTDISRVKEAGAEFIIMFPHWDYETDKRPANTTKALAKQLFEAGVDCIIGSHPHWIKSAEYMTVEREDGPYTGLVLYSLGNFVASESFRLRMGIFARLTLEKDPLSGKVSLTDAAVLPLFVLRRNISEGPRNTVVPAYKDPSRILHLLQPLTAKEVETIAMARESALNRFGTVEGIRILDETDPG